MTLTLNFTLIHSYLNHYVTELAFQVFFLDPIQPDPFRLHGLSLNLQVHYPTK